MKMGQIKDHTSHVKTLNMAGFEVLNTTSRNLLEIILRKHQKNSQAILFFANSNFIVKCWHLMSIIHKEQSEILIVNDGLALNVMSRLINHNNFIENLNGTDFSPYFLSQYPKKLKIYLLGATPRVVEGAKAYLSNHFPQHIVVGGHDGYFDASKNNQIISEINSLEADLVFVAMGNPIQEKWILNHKRELNASFIFAVGALFDFWSGDKVRAPKWVQWLKLEWFFRLCQEPKRLYKRYTVDMIKFVRLCIKHSKSN